MLDEIDGVLRGGAPGPEHVPRLALVDRVIKESMRLLPTTPILFVRTLAAGARLGMRMVATIQEPEVIRKILDHLDVLSTPLPRAPACDPCSEQTALGFEAG